jgi:hypothetical protein
MPLWFEIGVLALLFGIVFYLADIHSHLQDIRDVLGTGITQLDAALRDRDKPNSSTTLGEG